MASNLLTSLLGNNPGLTLQRAGEGFAGRLGQFDAQRARTQLLQQKEQRTQMDARRKAMAADFQQTLRLLNEGKPDVALNFLDQRLNLIDELGGDGQHTEQLRRMIVSGDIDAVKDQLGIVVNKAISTGLIDAGPETLADTEAGAAATARGRSRGSTKAKINAILDANPDLTKNEASNIATGVTSIRTDPVSGENFIVNIATGEQKPLNLPGVLAQEFGPQQPGTAQTTGTAQPPRQPGKRRTLFEIATGGNVAGLVPAALEAGSAVSGQLGGPVATQTIKDRQAFMNANQRLVKALQQSPRFAEGERKAIAKEINIEPRLLESTEGLLARMEEIKISLEQRLLDQLAISQDRNIPVAQRRQAIGKSKVLGQFLEQLGLPENTGQMGTTQNPATPLSNEDFANLPSGAIFVDPDDGSVRRKR